MFFLHIQQHKGDKDKPHCQPLNISELLLEENNSGHSDQQQRSHREAGIGNYCINALQRVQQEAGGIEIGYADEKTVDYLVSAYMLMPEEHHILADKKRP